MEDETSGGKLGSLISHVSIVEGKMHKEKEGHERGGGRANKKDLGKKGGSSLNRKERRRYTFHLDEKKDIVEWVKERIFHFKQGMERHQRG